MNENEREYKEVCVGCVFQNKCDYLLKKPRCYAIFKKKIQTLEDKILANELNKNNLLNNMDNICHI